MPKISLASTWRTPDLWVVAIIAVSVVFGVLISKVYRETAVPALMKSRQGRKIYSILPIFFAITLVITPAAPLPLPTTHPPTASPALTLSHLLLCLFGGAVAPAACWGRVAAESAERPRAALCRRFVLGCR